MGSLHDKQKYPLVPTPADDDTLAGKQAVSGGPGNNFKFSALLTYLRAKFAAAPLTVAEGGTGAASAEAARLALGAEAGGSAAAAVSAHNADTGAHGQTATGRAVLTAASAAAARAALGAEPAGTAGTAVDAHDGDTSAHGQTSVGHAVLTAPTAAAARAAIGVDAAGSSASSVALHNADVESHGQTSVGRAVLTAVDAAAGRTALAAEQAGTAASAVSTHDADTAAHGQTATGRAVLTAVDAAAGRTALGAETAGSVTTHNADTGAHGQTATGRSLLTAASATAANQVLGVAPPYDYLLIDSFRRADTAAGVLGTPEIGPDWVLTNFSGTPVMVPAVNGYLSGGVFTMPERNPPKAVYATQHFDEAPRQMGLSVKWAAGTGSDVNSSVVLSWSTDSDYINNMIHCVLARSYVSIEVREGGGAFVELGKIAFTANLAMDGSLTTMIVEVIGTKAILVISNPAFGRRTIEVSDARIASLHGPYCFWELYHNAATVAAMPSITRAWATRDSMSRDSLVGTADRYSGFTAPTTGQTVTQDNDSRDGAHGISSAGPLAALTVVLPDIARTVAGQRRGFYTNVPITAFTVSSTGGTFLDSLPSLAAGQYVEWERKGSTYWQLVTPNRGRLLSFTAPTTGGTANFSDNDRDQTAAISPAGTLATLSSALPSAANSRITQRVTFSTTQIVTAMTFTSSGGTIAGNVTTLPADGFITFEKVSATIWQRVG